MRLNSLLLVDGYTDEPGGLGVPPYIDVYPRLAAGAVWLANPEARIDYVTVDALRTVPARSRVKLFSRYDAVVFIAGVVVPGKYLGAHPVEPLELASFLREARGPLRILVGPAAKWGLGWEGGRPAYPPSYFKRQGADVLVTGDVEEYMYSLASEGEHRADPRRIRRDYRLYDEAAVRGAKIIRQHPNLGWNLTVELETYRGCARWVTGGCSFCVEPLRGRPIQRSVEGIVREVEALHLYGARSFRLGRQADILVYGSSGLGTVEWPRPDPDMLERLFRGVRSAAPGLETLHIDNVNPGTIARHPRESLEAVKNIIKYHTPGDVAAFGLETADPRVARINNLNTTPGEALEAIRLLNRVGARRGGNGLPELLPGLNFILGLPGETAETYRLNRLFLETLLRENLLVRRVNVRRLLPVPATRAYRMKHGIRGRREKHARSFTVFVRKVFDPEMLSRIVPAGTVLRNLWVELCNGSLCYARQTGSYPLIGAIRDRGRLYRGVLVSEARVAGVRSGRSVWIEPLKTVHPY